MKNEDIRKSLLGHAILDLVVASVLIVFFVVDKMWIDFWSHASAILFSVIMVRDLILSIVYFVKWKKGGR